MSATAPGALPPARPPAAQMPGRDHDTRAPDAGILDAVIDRPGDARALARFMTALERLDPADPRPERLTRALVAALSAPDGEASRAESFALRSLGFELSRLVPAGQDEIRFAPATLSLVVALLHHRCICSCFLEDVLICLRRSLLDGARTGAAPGAERLQLAEAMARHGFTSEYIWDETEAEAAAVDDLAERVSRAIGTGAPVPAHALYMIGAYRPLDAIPAVRNWVLETARRDPAALDPTLRLLVLDRLVEDAIRIETLTPVTSPVSRKVQSQYEENPYPRWRRMPAVPRFEGLGPYVAASIGPHGTRPAAGPPQPRVLVAGGGTGIHPIGLAQALPTAAVLAIDLSRASLAYAAREASARGVRNVAFAQADILGISGADLAFDLIESIGVLHHMEDPEAGLRALVDILKPGGYLHLGLYSAAARRAVNAARSRFAAAGHAPGLQGIRAFRRELIEAGDPALAPLRGFRDFYTASEFRDLVMHVQEHQFTIPRIAALLKRNGLKFLGFTGEDALAVLNGMPAKTARRRARDLEAWDSHERRHPETFRYMYRFICVKR